MIFPKMHILNYMYLFSFPGWCDYETGAWICVILYRVRNAAHVDDTE